jgi:hypothetical protein
MFRSCVRGESEFRSDLPRAELSFQKIRSSTSAWLTGRRPVPQSERLWQEENYFFFVAFFVVFFFVVFFLVVFLAMA